MDGLLLSGGIESTTLLYEHARTAHALFIDYGQRAARAERAAARGACARLAVPLTCLDARALSAGIAAPGLLRAHVPLAARNLFAVSLAANWALHHHARAILLGLQKDDRDHPEGRPATIQALEACLAALGVALLTPYAELTKREVVARGRALGIDYAATYSCLLGHRRPCGRCPQCRARQAVL